MTHTTIKLRQVGNSTGTIFPKEVLEALHVEAGDELHLIRTERGFEITPFDPAFDRAMQALERGRRKYRNALRELAK